jgi:hypothetical protein
MRTALCVATAVLLSIGTTAPAAAETILIRTGGVGFDTGTPPGLTLGGDGFLLQSLFPSIGEFDLCNSGPCLPGAKPDASRPRRGRVHAAVGDELLHPLLQHR